MAGVRMTLRVAVIATVVLGLVAATVAYRMSRPEMMEVTAHFRSTTGVYEGNKVDVLGMRVGTVARVIPEGTTNRVILRVDKSVPIPANAHAVILQDSLIADRHIALTPAYTGGPTLAPGAAIPLERAHSPVGFNELIDSVDQLLAALSGKEIQDGVSELVALMSKQVAGSGEQIRQIITGLSGPVATLAANDRNLIEIIKNADALISEIASRDPEVKAFARDITVIADMFADDSEQLRKTLGQLASATTVLAAFVRDNSDQLKVGLEDLAAVIERMAAKRRELTEVMDVFPLAMTNLINIRDPKTGLPQIHINIPDNMRYWKNAETYCTGFEQWCDLMHELSQAEDEYERFLDPNAGRQR